MGSSGLPRFAPQSGGRGAFASGAPPRSAADGLASGQEDEDGAFSHFVPSAERGRPVSCASPLPGEARSFPSELQRNSP